MEPGSAPKKVTSKRKIKYRESLWNVHQFEVWSTEIVCRVVVVKMEESLLLWVGGAGEPALGAVALGLPAERLPSRALATTLLAGSGEAEALALRVAAGLVCPVVVCSALPLDRFSAPLVELGLAKEIKKFPHFFYSSSLPKKDGDGVCSKNEGEDNKTCVKPESELLDQNVGCKSPTLLKKDGEDVTNSKAGDMHTRTHDNQMSTKNEGEG